MGLNYIGSKYSLLDFIYEVFNKEINKDEIECVGDLFAGTGVVGKYFKSKGYKIVANDIQYYSYVLNKKVLEVNHYLEFSGLYEELPSYIYEYQGEKRIKKILDYLNRTNKHKPGFIYYNYSLGGTKGKEYERQYFSDNNALKIDTIRKLIENWYKNNKLKEEEYFYLIGSLVEAADKVANTASVYGAFLKKLKKTAQKELLLEYNKIEFSDKNNKVFNEDILEILNKEKIDLLYLDPPYNTRQYCTNYHLLETIAKYDNPIIKGKTGLRDYSKQKSNFCIRKKVKEEFKKIVENTNSKYILVSYNNEGLMSIEDIQEILSLRGIPKTYKLEYNRFKADKTENRNHKTNKTYEFLHIVKCETTRNTPLKEEFPIIELTKKD